MVLKVDFGNELELKFREMAMKKYGFSKGALQKASRNAIEQWLKAEEKVPATIENPLSKLKGILKHLKGKYTSVELQHEAVKLWAK